MPSCWLTHSYARAHVPVQSLIALIYSFEQLIACILHMHSALAYNTHTETRNLHTIIHVKKTIVLCIETHIVGLMHF